jgi:ribosomal protein S18 acetylase RimI-like enzyme
MPTRVELADAGDAEAILAVCKAAFAAVARAYNDPELPPLGETVEQVEAELSSHVVLKAIVDGRVVGAVRAQDLDGVVHIGRLAVLPEYQGRGIGTALSREILDHFPDARRFELFTGHKSHAPLAIYRKLGFEVVREQRESDDLTLVYLERPGSPTGAQSSPDS